LKPRQHQLSLIHQPLSLSLPLFPQNHFSGDISGQVPATSPSIPHGNIMNAEPPAALLMSVSCNSDYDLHCAEETSGILSGESPECSSDIDSSPPPPSLPPSSGNYSIASFIEHERNFIPGFEYLSRFQSRDLDADAREESVAWILKVNK